MVTTRYDEMLLGGIAFLREKHGLRDPSVAEIACAAFRKPLPNHPLEKPDVLGGEIYDGVFKRLARLRDTLDRRGSPSAPVTERYYAIDGRNTPIEKHHVGVCLSSPGNPAQGIRFVEEDEEDVIYAEHLRLKLKAAIGYADRGGKQMIRVAEMKAIPVDDAIKLMTDLETGLVHTPREVIARLRNGATHHIAQQLS